MELTKNDNNHSIIKKLFEIPLDEKIYDDFGCALSGMKISHGRIFISENHICFNSDIIGFSTKIIIHMSEIETIIKKKTLLIDNGIEIIVKDKFKGKDGSYVFISFSNRNIVFNRIKSIIRSKGNLIENRSYFDVDGSYNLLYPSSELEEDEEERIFDFRNQQQASNSIKLDKTISKSPLIKKLSTNVDTEILNKSFISNILSNSILDKEDYIKIEDLMLKVNDDKILPKLVLNCSLNDFYNKFIKDNAEFSHNKYSELQERTEISTEEWSKIPENIELGNEMRNIVLNRLYDKSNIGENEIEEEGYFLRKYCFTQKVMGVPFVSNSRIVKCQKLVRKKNYIIFSSSSRSLDTPYSDYFTLDDNWELFSFIENGVEKTLLRPSFGLEFTKSTYFKGTIESRAKIDYEADFENYKSFIESTGITIHKFTGIKSKNNLGHGLVKDDDIENSEQVNSYWDLKNMFAICYNYYKHNISNLNREGCLVLVIASLLVYIMILKVDIYLTRVDCN